MSKNYIIITKEKPNSFESEQYRKLRTNIEYLSINKNYQVINITSSIANEGKTYSVLNLAHVYAQNNDKTLIIDMDLRNPKIHEAFGITNDLGLTNCIDKDFNVESVIKNVEPSLDVLPSGKESPYPSELLSSNTVLELIDELKKKYKKIIIDTPPIALFSDAKIVSNFADGTLFVVVSKKTRIDIAKKSIKELNLSDVDIIGAVLNRVSYKTMHYGKDYYYNKYGDNNK